MDDITPCEIAEHTSAPWELCRCQKTWLPGSNQASMALNVDKRPSKFTVQELETGFKLMHMPSFQWFTVIWFNYVQLLNRYYDHITSHHQSSPSAVPVIPRTLTAGAPSPDPPRGEPPIASHRFAPWLRKHESTEVAWAVHPTPG